MFADAEHVREMQRDLDEIIQNGIFNITKLLRNSETGVASGTPDDEHEFEMKSRSLGRRRMKNVDTGDLGGTLDDPELESEPQTHMDPRSIRRGFQIAKDEPSNPNSNQSVEEHQKETFNKSDAHYDPRSSRRQFSQSKESDFAMDKKPKSFSERFKHAQENGMVVSAYDSRLRHKTSGKRLTDQLIEQGILTEEMVTRLQEELLEDVDNREGWGEDKKS